MPPLLAAIPAIIGIGSGVAGTIEGAQAGNRQQKALSIQEQIAQQEATDKQQAFKQLTDFFTPYLQQGSPFLSMIQRSAAETNATGANSAAGQIRNTLGQTGLGYGPSGATAAALGGLGAETARTGSQNYLSNLLNNENIKFQAAQGINAAGSMAGSPQNQPNVSAQLPYQSTGSGLTGLSQILQGLLGGSGGGTGGGSYPIPPGGQSPAPGSGLPGTPGVTTSGTPTTQGWTL